MVKCDGQKKCAHRGFKDECLLSSSIYQCEHSIVVPEQDFNEKLGRIETNFDLSRRIADALERIATALEKANRLKALSFRKDSYVELDEVDEIMED